ncbi:MAG: hypothetical protein LBG58_16685 [Planctomycetaceae bacterium]|jgi:hypothetical protein|nr:hypothetical protein [Planctomycetaceae bacterium]
MSTLTNLIEDIKLTLAHSDAVSPEKIQILATQYADECRRLNERFRTILPSLQNGNLSEAIRLAEMPPNLTDWYGTLNFENREEWVEIVQALDFDEPLPLPEEIMLLLNDAYLTQSPLEPLLKQNRLYALNDSPIADRLQVIRAIAKYDTQNFFWREDIEKFEKIRHTQLKQDVNKALQTKDNTAVSELFRELSAPDWIAPPPKEYRLALFTFMLQGYQRKLQKAFDAYNYPDGQQCYDSMLRLCEKNRIPMPASINAEIQPAVDWLANESQILESQERFDTAVAELKETLENGENIQELDRCYYSAEQAAANISQTLPRETMEWYKRRKQNFEQTRQNRLRVTVTLIVAVCLLIVSGISYGLIVRNFTAQVEAAVTSLQSVKDEKRYDDIDQTIERVEKKNAKVAADPKVEKLFDELRIMQKEDKERAANFERALTQIEIALDEKPELAELKKLTASIENCEKLKRTNEEETKFSDMKRKHQVAVNQRQRELDTAFGDKLAVLSKQWNEIRRSRDIKQMTELESEIKSLLQQSPEVSAKQLSEGKEFLTDIQNVTERVRKAQSADEIVKQIREVSGWNSYQTALKRLVNDHPSHEAVSDAKNILAQLDDTNKIVQTYAALSKKVNDCSKNMSELQKHIAEINPPIKILTEKTGTDVDAFIPFIKRFDKIAETKPLGAETFRKTNDVLVTISKSKLYPLIYEKKWYYMVEAPSETAENRGKYKYKTSVASTEKEIKEYKIKADINKIAVDTNKQLTGNQFEFAVEARKELRSIGNDTPLESAVDKIEKILTEMQDQTGLDPILKCVILKYFLDDFSAVEPVFKETFQNYLKSLTDSKLDFDYNWMEVESDKTETQRNLAESQLRILPDLKSLFAKAKQDFKRFVNSLTIPDLTWLGIVDRPDNTRWTCTGSLTGKSGTLWVFRKEHDKMQPIKIGTLKDGNVSIDRQSECVRFLPVYLMNNHD